MNNNFYEDNVLLEDSNRHFEIKQLDQAKLIKQNDLKEITNPSMFNANGNSPDGLLSNEIFGITKEDRSGIFAYIDLNEYFIQPWLYKVWLKIDKRLRSIVYETKYFKISANGELVEDEDGETGIKFLKKNIDKIKFKNTKRDALLKALNDSKPILFTNKFVIIPPFYRDVDTSKGKKSVGEINRLYVNLINQTRALKESNEYGLSMAGGIRGKIQDTMLEITNWFMLGESIIGGEHTGSGIFKKYGTIRRSNMSKTTDYGARLVISAPKIDVDSVDDMMVDMDYCALPLSAACTVFYPYMMFHLRHYFENEFGGKTHHDYIDKNGKLQQIELDSPEIAFSDDVIDKELNNFIHGFSNRIVPINYPNKENKEIAMRFKGYHITAEEYNKGIRENEKIIERDITWCDLFYMAACECAEELTLLITRYPMDSYFNQFPCNAHISSTVETEPMVINGKFYKWYPKIEQKDIGANTSNMFIDTLSISNPYCILMGADYDGDQVSVKALFSVEANKELKDYINSKGQFIDVSGINGRKADKEALQAMYNLTLTIEDKNLPKLTEKIEF